MVMLKLTDKYSKLRMQAMCQGATNVSSLRLNSVIISIVQEYAIYSTYLFPQLLYIVTLLQTKKECIVIIPKVIPPRLYSSYTMAVFIIPRGCIHHTPCGCIHHTPPPMLYSSYTMAVFIIPRGCIHHTPPPMLYSSYTMAVFIIPRGCINHTPPPMLYSSYTMAVFIIPHGCIHHTPPPMLYSSYTMAVFIIPQASTLTAGPLARR